MPIPSKNHTFLPVLLCLALAFGSCSALAAEPARQKAPPPGADRVLFTLEAPLADGRTLTLRALGRPGTSGRPSSCGVRRVQVCEGETLLQTISASEALEAEWGPGWSAYTECWSPEEVMTVGDMNFDGNADFGLFGWPANNTIPYFYWFWDSQMKQYRYACTLQGAEIHPETGEVSSEYKGDPGCYNTDYYRPDETGCLLLVRREVSSQRLSQDNDRFGLEVYQVREGCRIPARPEDPIDDQLILVRREIPLLEVQGEAAACFTEIWELQAGELVLTSREPYPLP